MRSRGATNSVPLLNTRPFGELRPFSTVRTTRLPPCSVMAYTLEPRRLPTKTVPLSPSAMNRASGTPSVHSSTLKPRGTFSLSTDNSLAGRPVRLGRKGCSDELFSSSGLPCCHGGGAAGAAAGGLAGGLPAGVPPGLAAPPGAGAPPPGCCCAAAVHAAVARQIATPHFHTVSCLMPALPSVDH